MNKNFSDIIMQSHYIYSVTFNPHFVDTHIDIVQWQMEIQWKYKLQKAYAHFLKFEVSLQSQVSSLHVLIC